MGYIHELELSGKIGRLPELGREINSNRNIRPDVLYRKRLNHIWHDDPIYWRSYITNPCCNYHRDRLQKFGGLMSGQRLVEGLKIECQVEISILKDCVNSQLVGTGVIIN